MEKSPSSNNDIVLNETKIEFIETISNEDFKKNVCIPYFRDIYKVVLAYLINSLYRTSVLDLTTNKRGLTRSPY